MAKSEKILPANKLVPLGLNPDGSEIVDTTPMMIGLRGPVKSAEVKLKEMMDRELERRARREETELDGYDFDLPDESIMLHPSVEVNPMSAKDIRKAYREQQQLKKQKAANNAAAEGAKGPAASPKQPANGNKASKDSARDNATEGAESAEED